MTEYPPEEWRITGELIRQIGAATTWQRMIEAGDALMNVSRMAKSLRDEQNQDVAKDTAMSGMSIGLQGSAARPFDIRALGQMRKDATY